MKTRSLGSKLVLLLLIFWIAISFIRTAFNLSKVATEERHWYVLSDEQKRALEFGDLHSFFRFVQAHTKAGRTMLFITDSDEAYYLSRYYLYPTKVIRPYQPGIWKPDTRSYTYFVVYPVNHTKLLNKVKSQSYFRTYRKLATYRGQSGELGLIYTQ